jgi:hypothetical protein
MHPDPVLAHLLGNAQLLGNGDVFVDWGVRLISYASCRVDVSDAGAEAFAGERSRRRSDRVPRD